MKATFEIPDDLYRLAKAKSALEGRALREVAIELFRTYVAPRTSLQPSESPTEGKPRTLDGRPVPSWFGQSGRSAPAGLSHDMEEIRESIGRGFARERKL
jgi:hypothetical protein